MTSRAGGFLLDTEEDVEIKGLHTDRFSSRFFLAYDVAESVTGGADRRSLRLFPLDERTLADRAFEYSPRSQREDRVSDSCTADVQLFRQIPFRGDARIYRPCVRVNSGEQE